VAAPYIAETQTARWTSDAVHQAFLDLGFKVQEWPLTQYLEKQVPADSAFFSPEFSKLFGFQYKTIYHNGEDFWPLDDLQHKTLQKHRWIYYCCSELRDPADHGIALHLARIYQGRFDFQPEIPAKGFFRGQFTYYMRFGAFIRALKLCRAGIRLSSIAQLRDLLAPVSGVARRREVEQMLEFFLVDFNRRTLLAERIVGL
jgi:hypothetical protein